MANTTTLSVVPWYSRAEWQAASKYLYSDDSELQKNGYSILCTWKQRCVELPAGIECTMEMIQIHLRDRSLVESSGQGYNDLQLMYSTAIMRCLNLLSEINASWTMYKTAEDLCLPDWIVNIRHCVAHGNRLPGLSMLRTAANLILHWLYENYWNVEAAHHSEDLRTNHVENENSSATKMRQVLESWEALRLRGCDAAIEAFPQLVTRLQPGGQSPLELKSKTAVLRSLLLKDVQELFEGNSSIESGQHFAEMLLRLDTFIPPATIFFMQESNGTSAFEKAVKMWEDIVAALWEWNVIQPLLLQLVGMANTSKLESQRHMAAEWLKYIAAIYKRMAEVRRRSGSDRKSQIQPAHSQLMQFVRAATRDVSDVTITYLPSYLDLLRPSLASVSRQKLLALVSLYSGSAKCAEHDTFDSKVHTLSDLQSHIKPSCDNNGLDHWKICQGDSDWETIALGVLPWQPSLPYLQYQLLGCQNT